jgi:anti-sigma factor RsiW
MLADYIDGGLAQDDAERIDAHLRECDRCAKFGGDYAALVEKLRDRLGSTETSDEAQTRLADRMESVWEGQS